MVNFNLIILSKKTKYFLIYIYYNLYIFLYGFKLNQNQINIYILPKNLLYILTFLKYNSVSNLINLVDIVVVDNISFNKYRFEITYIFWNIFYEYRINLKLFTNGYNLVYSLSQLYKSSIWLERELWDFFGIKFLFHTGLRKILTDYGFKGHPLKKDFPLLGYIDIYYDDSIQAIKYNPIELAQSLRFFKFENPWNKWYI